MSEVSRAEFEQLKATVEAQGERIQGLEQELKEERETHAKETAQDRRQIKELEAELKEERETRAKEDAQDRKRLHDVEERLEDVEEGGSPNETPTLKQVKPPSRSPKLR